VFFQLHSLGYGSILLVNYIYDLSLTSHRSLIFIFFVVILVLPQAYFSIILFLFLIGQEDPTSGEEHFLLIDHLLRWFVRSYSEIETLCFL
jgi:hypothetical protein